MTKVSRCVFLMAFFIIAPRLGQLRADEAVLKEIRLGWQAAIAASQKCTTFEKVVRTRMADGSSSRDRYLLLKQGSKFVVGTSNHGNVQDSKQKNGTLQVFDGHQEALAVLDDAVDQAFSHQQPWILSGFNRTGTPARQRPLRHFDEVGLVFGNSVVRLGHLFPDHEYISVDKLTSELEAGRKIWKLEWSIPAGKKPAEIRLGVTNGILWLDSEKSYLPIRSELVAVGQWSIKDKFTYRPNLGSYYCEKTETQYDFFADGKTETVYIDTELKQLSDAPIPAEVFTFGHYGLKQPEVVRQSQFPWYLIIIGLLLIFGTVIVRRYVDRSV